MKNLKQQFSKYNKSLEKTRPQYSALLGKTKTIVEHPTRNGFCYARMADNLNELIVVFNDKVSQAYNLPVLVSRRGNTWYVVGRDTQRYQDWGSDSSFLPKHARQHEFNRDDGTGADTVFVYPDQMIPLLVYPSGTSGAGNVMIAPYLLQRTSDFIYVGNTGTRNLLIYKPTNNQGIMGLVYLDKTTGNPGFLVASGTPFAGSITGTAALAQYAPYPSSNQEPLYFVRLVSGTTAIQWENLYNARQFIGGSAGSSITLPIGSSSVLMPGIDEATGTYTHTTDFSIRGSAGVSIGQPTQYITATGTSSINVSGGVGYIRTTNAQNGDLVFCAWQATGSISIPAPAAGQETTRFIGVEYNSGNPQVTVRTSFNWNWYNDFPLGRVSYDGINLRILNTYAHSEDTANLTRKMLRLTMPFQREQAPEGTGGLEVSDVATRQLAMTSGNLWHGFNKYSMSAVAAGTPFVTAYRRSGGGFNQTGTATQWPNTQYDDGSGALVTMGNNKFACLWIYIDIADNKLNVIYGRNEYNTSALAQAEAIPATAPDHLNYHGRLASRFVFQKSATSATIVESAWTSAFIGGSAGGSSLPIFITGSIPFSSPDGTLGESNQSFFWNTGTNSQWIGNRPPSALQIGTVQQVLTSPTPNTSSVQAIAVYGTGTSGNPSPLYNGYRSRGTLAAPTPVQTGDILIGHIGSGYDGANFMNSTRIAGVANANWITGSNTESRLDFEVTPSGSATRRVGATLYGDSFNLANTGTYNVNGIDVLALKQSLSEKNAASGYVGLTSAFAMNFKDGTGAYTSFLANAATASRMYEFPDKSIIVAGIVDITPNDGWIAISQTWTYASADAPVYQIYVSGDVTANADYKLGNKIKCTISGAVKYGFIVKVGSYDGGNTRTPVDIYCGTDYTMSNSAITAAYISKVKSPDGFPLSPTKWTVEFSDTSNRTQSSPAAGTKYNPGSLAITIPIGNWKTEYMCVVDGVKTSAVAAEVICGLSTANNSESDADFRCYAYLAGASGTLDVIQTLYRVKNLTLTTKTIYYLIIWTNTASMTSIGFDNALSKCFIRAICTYL